MSVISGHYQILRQELINYRENVLKPTYRTSKPENGLLRRSMLDWLIINNVTTEQNFNRLIPDWMLKKTDPLQLPQLKHVLDIISRHVGPAFSKDLLTPAAVQYEGCRNRKTGLLFLCIDENDDSFLVITPNGMVRLLDADIFDELQDFDARLFTSDQIEALDRNEEKAAFRFLNEVQSEQIVNDEVKRLMRTPRETFLGLSNWAKTIPEFQGDLRYIYGLGDQYRSGMAVDPRDYSRGLNILRKAIRMGFNGRGPKPWQFRR